MNAKHGGVIRRDYTKRGLFGKLRSVIFVRKRVPVTAKQMELGLNDCSTKNNKK